MEDKIIVYTDGAVSNNGSKDARCGWAVLMLCNGGNVAKCGFMVGKTNNYMEMWAVHEALKSITNKSIPVELISDSKYVIETIKGNYRIGANEELWERIEREVKEFSDISFTWVKGHNGNIGNEIVNDLAEGATKWKVLIGKK